MGNTFKLWVGGTWACPYRAEYVNTNVVVYDPAGFRKQKNQARIHRIGQLQTYSLLVRPFCVKYNFVGETLNPICARQITWSARHHSRINIPNRAG